MSLFLAAAIAIGAQSIGDATTASATIQKYCVSCHNDRLKTAGLTLANLDVAHPSAQSEIWGKVIRKLRTRAMPPPNVPHPNEQTYDAIAGYLETSIDREAMSTPHPGKLALDHRLSRTEYQNAIRDLLAIDALPKEIDYALLLPADNSASGFDNLADLLFMSPAIMERYLDDAEKISRLAVGDTQAPVLVNRYRLSAEQWQGSRVDDLPWGTRGGMSAKTTVPADGEYLFKIQLAAPPTEPHQLEVVVDGERAQLVSLGVATRGRRGQPPPRTGEADPDRPIEL